MQLEPSKEEVRAVRDELNCSLPAAVSIAHRRKLREALKYLEARVSQRTQPPRNVPSRNVDSRDTEFEGLLKIVKVLVEHANLS